MHRMKPQEPVGAVCTLDGFKRTCGCDLAEVLVAAVAAPTSGPALLCRTPPVFALTGSDGPATAPTGTARVYSCCLHFGWLQTDLWLRFGGGFGGCSCCSHFCKTNKHVCHAEFNVQTNSERPRVSFGADGKPIAMVAPVLKCSNPSCPGKEPEPGTDKHRHWNRDSEKNQVHKFGVWTKEAFSQYPKSVRERYSKYFSGIGVNEDGTTYADEALNLEILDDRTNFEALAERLDKHYQRLREAARRSYLSFVSKQQPARRAGDNQTIHSFVGAAPPPGINWPAFDEEQFDYDFHPPKVDAIKSLFWIAFGIIKPHLMRDLLDRTPGRILRWDATFDFTSKIMDDLLSEEQIKALGIIWGEHGHILSYAFFEGESPTNWQRMHMGLHRRCERKGKQYVDAVIAGYSDLCCENHIDPTEHWFPKIWPNVVRAPLKDSFHGVKMATEAPATAGPEHPLHTNWCRKVSSALLEFPPAEKLKVIRNFQKKQPGTASDLAWDYIIGSKSWKKKMKNRTHSIRDAVAALEEAWSDLEQKDQALADQALLNGEHYVHYIKSAVPNYRRGTEYEVKNLISHLEKGCYADPLPIDQMNIPAKRAKKPKKDVLPNMLRLRGTSMGESSNKQVNNARNNATRLSAELADARILLRIARINRQKDAAVEHITGIAPKPLLWYIQEALDKMAAEIAHLEPSARPFKYPSLLADEPGQSEPIGLEFSRTKCWNEIDGRIAASNYEWNVLQGSEASSPAIETGSQGEQAAGSVLSPGSVSSPGNVSSPDSAPPPSNESAGEATEPLDLCPEIAAAAIEIADDFAAQNNPPPPEPQGSQRDDLAHGATTWNRPLGPRAGRTHADMRASVPLNSFQVSRFGCIAQQAAESGTRKTTNQLAKHICNIWNAEHTELLAHRKAPGLGGYLEISVAEAQLKGMANAAFALETPAHPTAQVTPILPIPLEQQGEQKPPARLPGKGGRPQKRKRVLRPVEDLDCDYLETLTARELHHYTQILEGKKPKQKSDALELVKKHLKE